MDPEVLLMDEPFTALDAQSRDLLHEELEQVWSSTKKTIVFVTHNLREAVRLADEPVQQRLRLKVIEGGGHGDGMRHAPALTVVGRR